jgi:hypothetical protein
MEISCPWCQAVCVVEESRGSFGFESFSSWPIGYQVRCGTCGKTGPFRATVADAKRDLLAVYSSRKELELDAVVECARGAEQSGA